MRRSHGHVVCTRFSRSGLSVGRHDGLARQDFAVVEATFAESSQVLGYDLWQRCQEGPAELLDATECTQPAMLTAGVATYRLWLERGGAVPRFMAGHSLGRVHGAGGGWLPGLQDRGRPRQIPRRGDAVGRAARGGGDGRDSRVGGLRYGSCLPRSGRTAVRAWSKPSTSTRRDRW